MVQRAHGNTQLKAAAECEYGPQLIGGHRTLRTKRLARAPASVVPHIDSVGRDDRDLAYANASQQFGKAQRRRQDVLILGVDVAYRGSADIPRGQTVRVLMTDFP